MVYTVSEVSNISGVTVKTLYHYHKIGLLYPQYIGENGYRYYGEQQLEQLQQILLYRALDFPLDKIKTAMMSKHSRLNCLLEQKELLLRQQDRVKDILQTLEQSILHAKEGVHMKTEKLFVGLNEQMWEQAFYAQNEHLEQTFGYTLDTAHINAEALNEQAEEAALFLKKMAKYLREGKTVDDADVLLTIANHIAYLSKTIEIDAQHFITQARFLMMDAYHRRMMEAEQMGLSCYIYCAAEAHANQT